MNKEIDGGSRGGRGPSVVEGKKIHKSHFPVDVKVPLKDEGYNAKYEWVNLGNGKCKLVRKNQKMGPKDRYQSKI